MIKCTPSFLRVSRCFRARANAASVGTEMYHEKFLDDAPVAPPRPSKMDIINATHLNAKSMSSSIC